VLIADDDPVVAEALCEDLESAHYELLVAGSGEACLVQLEQVPVDLLLLDLVMPDMSGFEVLRRLSDSPRLRNMPVLVLSSRAQDVVRALKAGAVDYLIKPWQPEELLARVHTHVRLRQRESELADAVRHLNQRTLELENEMTERKRAEAQLVMASRMSSLGVVAAGVAHEINNPLTYLIGNLDLLRDRLDDRERAAPEPAAQALVRMADQARDGAERVRLIVRDLKAFSRPDSEELEAVNLLDVLDSVLRLAGHEIKHRATVIRDCPPVPDVVGNVARLSQVLLNVVANATQAMEHGSPERDRLQITTRFSAEDGMVEIRLRDTGKGMDGHSLEHAFDLFYTTRGKGSGTGLGLALCRKIVEGFGGRISLSSALGAGTEVTIRLPVYGLPSEVPVNTLVLAANTRKPSRDRVLVIDDEREIANLVSAMLRQDFDVEVCLIATDAIAKLRAGHVFDVIVCDLMMSECSGMEVYEIVEREFPELARRFVFMTGGPCTARASTFVEKHARNILDKPFTLGQLEAAVERARTPAAP